MKDIVKYQVGWHSSDDQYVHVAAIRDGECEDLFDVTLYGNPGEDECGRDKAESLAALEQLVFLANTALRWAAERRDA